MADRTVFVIRDFEVDKSVGLALQFLAQFPPAGTKLSIPGIPGAAEQGRLIDDVLDPALGKSQYVISFMDTLNANVGFELGFALGSDRQVALVCAATELPRWLDAAPLSGYLIAKGVQLPRLQKIIEQGEQSTSTGRLQADPTFSFSHRTRMGIGRPRTGRSPVPRLPLTCKNGLEAHRSATPARWGR